MSILILRSAAVIGGGGGAGTLAHGNTYTIDGGSWDSRASPTPHLYDDFSGGTNGQLITTTSGAFNDAVYGTWESDDRNGNTSIPEYSSTKVLQGKSAWCGYRFPSPYTADLRPLFKSGFGPVLDSGTKMYFEWNFNWERLAGQTGFSRNWKLWRWQSGSPNDPNLHRRCQCVMFPNGVNNFAMDANPNMTTDFETAYSGWSEFFATGQGGYLPDEDVWHTVQHMWLESTAGTANGGFASWWNNHLMGGALSGITTRGASGTDNELYEALNFPHYYAPDTVDEQDNNCDMDLYIGCVYLDLDWRVLHLGNAAAWDDCTKRATQPQTSRSTSEIQFLVNQGRFVSGDPVYAYVRNADGTLESPIDLGTWP